MCNYGPPHIPGSCPSPPPNKKFAEAVEQIQIVDERDQLRSKIKAAWAALGTTAEEAADDPDTKELADAIRVSLHYERNRVDEVLDAATRDLNDTTKKWRELVDRWRAENDELKKELTRLRELISTLENKS